MASFITEVAVGIVLVLLTVAATLLRRRAARASRDCSKLRATWRDDAETIKRAIAEGFRTCDVFLSHAGPQKWDVIDTLRTLLPSYITKFADAWNLAGGERSEEKMIKACGTARVGVVVVSRQFMQREWPMRELHILVERHRRGEVELVALLWFEVFEDFEALVSRYKRCSDHRCLWAEDLEYLMTTCMVKKGAFTEHRALHAVAQEVVDAVVRALAPVRAGDGEGAVGVDNQVERLRDVMKPEPGKAGKAVWLHGPGGIGKTELAKQLRRCLETAGLVRRTAVLELAFTAGDGGPPRLLEEQAVTVLKAAVNQLSGRDCSSATPEQVRAWFAVEASQAATLLVVDNVHSQEQIGRLLAEPLKLNRVPFLIFTSRLREPMAGSQLAKVWLQVNKRLHQHEVLPLCADSPYKLFREHCERPECVPESLEKSVVEACGGLPLALLIVAGCLVHKDDPAVWKDAARALQEGGDPAGDSLAESEFGLQKVMGYSLLDLGSAATSMFLDTACVLAGQAEGDALAVWQLWHDSSMDSIDAAACLRKLKNRHLLATDDEGRLWMHDVLRWFGRRVVRGEVELPGGQQHRHSRLWVHDGRVEPQDAVGAGGGASVVTAGLHEDEDEDEDDDVDAVVHPLRRVTSGVQSQDTILNMSGGRMALNTSAARILLVGRQHVALPPTLLWLECKGPNWAADELITAINSSNKLCILRIRNVPTLTELPQALGLLSCLKELRLQSCLNLTSLPESLGQLSSLQHLTLKGCSWLTGLPDSVGQLSSLQCLDLSFCTGVTVLPESIGRLSSLQYLGLSGCGGLTVLPESVGRLSSLQYLGLSGCSGLTVLPELVQLSSLQELDLSGCNGLTELPESVGQLSSLQYLDLGVRSGLTMLPESAGRLSALQYLHLSGRSGLTELPESVGQLSVLQYLNLNGRSGLTDLPESVGQLSALQYLNLNGCSGLTVLPESVGQLSSLERLFIGCSGLTVLPESVGQLSSLQDLFLSGCSGLTELPESVGQLSSLESLGLDGCSGLTELPESVGQLSSLQYLGLDDRSGLTLWPELVGRLSSLNYLKLSGFSGLTSLPEWVGQLSSLQCLELSGYDELTELRESVGWLASLHYLNLSGCSGLTVLPDWVGQMSSLQRLYLGGCSGLTVLPDWVGQMSSLQYLDLSGCSGLTVLPESVGQLSSLQSLDLRGCSRLSELPESVGQLVSKGMAVRQ